MESKQKEKKNVGVKLMPTKAGKGYKLVVGEKWFYTSKPELAEMLEGESNACDFRTIEEGSPSPFQGRNNVGGDEE